MRVLFVHQNFPGQYRHVAPALAARPGTEVVALGINPAPALPGVRHIRYPVAGRSTPGIHPFAASSRPRPCGARRRPWRRSPSRPRASSPT